MIQLDQCLEVGELDISVKVIEGNKIKVVSYGLAILSFPKQSKSCQYGFPGSVLREPSKTKGRGG